jgi:hypothetical protein
MRSLRKLVVQQAADFFQLVFKSLKSVSRLVQDEPLVRQPRYKLSGFLDKRVTSLSADHDYMGTTSQNARCCKVKIMRGRNHDMTLLMERGDERRLIAWGEENEFHDNLLTGFPFEAGMS